MQYPYAPPPQQPPNEVDGLKREIDSLISRFQQTLASNPQNAGLGSQLGALRQLRTLLDSRTMSPTELQQIKHQVAALSTSLPPPPAVRSTPQPPIPVPTPQWQQPPMPPYSQPYQPPQQQTAPPPLPFPPPMPPGMPPGLPPNALNGLQALLANVPKPSTPQMRAAVPGLREATHSQLNTVQNNTTAPNANDPGNLLATLAKAGLLGPTTVPPAPPPTSLAPPADPTAALLRSLQGVVSTPQSNTPSHMPLQPPGASAIPLTASSLKTFRPELVHALYDAQSNQCNTCGRRFLATDDGREKKRLHLDWHFRMNQRIADPNTNRGHHRNWFVDEMDWIRHKEFDPSTTTAAAAAETGAAAKPKKGPQDQCVRAPAGMTKNTCNICFEEMKSSYSEDLQDWIFANATVHNGKIVHATCLAEMTKPGPGAGGSSLAAALASFGAGQKERSATPDSLLGKRKAETAMTGGGVRMRTE